MLEVSDSLILAQRAADFPITKAIYVLFERLGDGQYIASAMGVWAMMLLAHHLGRCIAPAGQDGWGPSSGSERRGLPGKTPAGGLRALYWVSAHPRALVSITAGMDVLMPYTLEPDQGFDLDIESTEYLKDHVHES